MVNKDEYKTQLAFHITVSSQNGPLSKRPQCRKQ